jgi:hypothetical protein
VYRYMCICIQSVCICMRMYRYTYIHTHIHSHTHTQLHRPVNLLPAGSIFILFFLVHLLPADISVVLGLYDCVCLHVCINIHSNTYINAQKSDNNLITRSLLAHIRSLFDRIKLERTEKKFWKVSAVIHLLYKVIINGTFQNLCLRSLAEYEMCVCVYVCLCVCVYVFTYIHTYIHI